MICVYSSVGEYRSEKERASAHTPAASWHCCDIHSENVLGSQSIPLRPAGEATLTPRER